MNEKSYVDKNLIQNSTLACLVITYFVKKYEILNADLDSPNLLKILLVLPLIWHKESCILINKRNKTTSFYTLLAENSIIKANFEKRIAEFSAISIQGMNLGCSTKLLEKIEADNEVFITSNFKRWPSGYKYTIAPKEMISAINRLAYWFKNHSTAELYLMLLGK